MRSLNVQTPQENVPYKLTIGKSQIDKLGFNRTADVHLSKPNY